MKEYFKRFVECINLEQAAEKDRQSSSYTTNINKETDLQIEKVNSNQFRGVIVVLQKVISETKTSELAERTFVNLYTDNNISFGKGFIVARHYYLRELKESSQQETCTATYEPDDAFLKKQVDKSEFQK